MTALTPRDLMDRLEAGPVAVRVLHNATLTDGTRCDLRLEGGLVLEVAAPQTLPVDDGSLDLTGYVVTGAGAEAHAHLDKALSVGGDAALTPPVAPLAPAEPPVAPLAPAEPPVAPLAPAEGPVPGYGNLHHAIEQWRLICATADEENYYRRARAAALELLGNGVTAIRSHCNLIDGDQPFVGLRALVRVREELRDVMDIEIAILPAPWSPTSDIAGAMEAGADIVGGCPHLSDDPEAELDRLVELAHRYGVGIDIHADEQLTPTMLSVRSLARHAMSKPIPGTVTAGHCVSLGVLDQPLLGEVVAELAAAGVGVVSLPITNLYLQGWEHPVSTPRGLTAVRALLDGGVTLAGGGDNIRDPFNPVGRADPLETASLLVVAGHLTVEEAMQAVTAGGRRVMGLPDAGPAVGLVADLLACRGTSLVDVVARAPGDRLVLHAGRVVSGSVSRTVVAGGLG